MQRVLGNHVYNTFCLQTQRMFHPLKNIFPYTLSGILLFITLNGWKHCAHTKHLVWYRLPLELISFEFWSSISLQNWQCFVSMFGWKDSNSSTSSCPIKQYNTIVRLCKPFLYYLNIHVIRRKWLIKKFGVGWSISWGKLWGFEP